MILPGRLYRAPMAHSEVCIHLQVAGRPMLFRLLDRRMVQLYRENGEPYSAPILTCEAGVHEWENGEMVCYGAQEVAPPFGW